MSITEIAKRAGVSYVTVSRVLNHPERVNPATREKIQKIFKELNYKPKIIPNKLNTVNLLIPSPQLIMPQDSQVLSRLTSRITEKQYHAVISPPGINLSHNLFHKAYIAILHNGDTEILNFIRKNSARLPFVVINDLTENVQEPVALISSDHKQGTATAIEYLLGKGHRNIGYIGDPLTSKGFTDAYREYENIMKSKGYFDENCVFLNDKEMLFEGIKRLCMKKVTAVFIAAYDLTQSSLYYLNLLGKRIPDDISVVAKEYESCSPLLYPPISTIVQPLKRLSDTAIEVIFDKIETGAPASREVIYTPYAFVERESVIRRNP